MWVHPYWDDVPNIGTADLEYNQMLQLLEIDEVLYEIVLSLEEDNK